MGARVWASSPGGPASIAGSGVADRLPHCTRWGPASIPLAVPALARPAPIPLSFLCRFGSQLLGLAPDAPLPSLQQLEAALLGEAAPPQAPAPPADAMAVDGEGGAAAEEGDGAPPPDAAVQLQMALADFLVSGLFQDTAAAIVGELLYLWFGCGPPAQARMAASCMLVALHFLPAGIPQWCQAR